MQGSNIGLDACVCYPISTIEVEISQTSHDSVSVRYHKHWFTYTSLSLNAETPVIHPGPFLSRSGGHIWHSLAIMYKKSRRKSYNLPPAVPPFSHIGSAAETTNPLHGLCIPGPLLFANQGHYTIASEPPLDGECVWGRVPNFIPLCVAKPRCGPRYRLVVCDWRRPSSTLHTVLPAGCHFTEVEVPDVEFWRRSGLVPPKFSASDRRMVKRKDKRGKPTDNGDECHDIYINGGSPSQTLHIMFDHRMCNTDLRRAVMWGAQILSRSIEKDISGSLNSPQGKGSFFLCCYVFSRPWNSPPK